MEENQKNPISSDSNLMAALSYVWILSIIILIVKKDDRFVRFHAKQGSILFALSIVAMVLTPLVFFVGPLIWILVVILEVLGFIKALAGEWYNVPVIGNVSKRTKI